MGLNIGVVKYLGVQTHKDVIGEQSYVMTGSYDGFDSLRHSGDKDFAVADLFINLGDDEDAYYRPKDFSESRQWVKANVIECNQQRLLNILDEMEKDEQLCFHFSW